VCIQTLVDGLRMFGHFIIAVQHAWLNNQGDCNHFLAAVHRNGLSVASHDAASSTW
jgi:hypothetical protein